MRAMAVRNDRELIYQEEKAPREWEEALAREDPAEVRFVLRALNRSIDAIEANLDRGIAALGRMEKKLADALR